MTLRTRIALIAVALAFIVIYGISIANARPSRAPDLNAMTPIERADYWQQSARAVKYERRKYRQPRVRDANANSVRRATASRDCLTSDTLSILNRAEAHFGVTFKVVSTCRPGAMIRGTIHASWHASNRAVDLVVPRGTSKAAVVKWLYENASGVTMTYRRMPHIHFDTGNYHKLTCDGCGRKYSARSEHHTKFASRR
jgi:uncharacterized protein YcbK (DUF882 family)